MKLNLTSNELALYIAYQLDSIVPDIGGLVESIDSARFNSGGGAYK